MTDARALIGRLGALPPLSTLAAPDLGPFVSRTAELGYETMWIGDAVARDPFAQLAAVVDAAGGMALGTNIVNIYGRDAMATKMGAMTLHELTGGRFLLGIGVSHEHLVSKLRGHVYGPPLTKMREYLAQYASLPYAGPTVTGPDGEPDEPPLMLAALRPKMTRLSATDSAGALPYFVSTARVAWMRQELDAAAPADQPRPVLAVALPVILETDAHAARTAARAWSQPYCRAINYQNSLIEQGYVEADFTPPYSDRLMDDIFAWGDADTIRARIDGMHEAGADHVMVIPIDATGGNDYLTTLEAIAPRV